MTDQLQQFLAANALIVTCEQIVGDGLLPEAEEQVMRLLIAKCCKAFEIPSIAERVPANDTSFDSQLDLITRVLNADGAL